MARKTALRSSPLPRRRRLRPLRITRHCSLRRRQVPEARRQGFEQVASIEVSDFDPYASGWAIEKIFKPARGLQSDDTAAVTYLDTLRTKLDGCERILTKTKWLAGDDITLADIFHLPYGTLLPQDDTNPLLDPKRPHVFNWWKELIALPSWKAVRWDSTH